MRLPDVHTNKLIVDVVRTFDGFGGGEAGRLWAGKFRPLDHSESWKRTFWMLV